MAAHPGKQQLVSRILFKNDPNLSEYSDQRLAIALEEADVKGETVLLGRVQLVLDG